MLSRLFDLIASPIALACIPLVLFVLSTAKRSPRVAWLLFTLCCFAASLAKFRDQFILEPPALVFPLQQLREIGRPLSIMLLGLLLVLGMQTKKGWRRQLMPPALHYLIVVQGVIFFKTLAYGSIGFAFLAALTFGAVILMLKLAPCSWLQDEASFQLAVWSVAMVGVIFVIANGYQGAVNIYAITFIHGRLLGTTGNPQHAAVLLSSTVPCLMFLFENHQRFDWHKGIWLASLVFVAIALFMTGSRTGALMTVVTIVLFYRTKGVALVRFGLLAAIALVIIVPLLGQDGILFGADVTSVGDRFSSSDNTRAHVWSAMWRGFSNNPFFGAPLRGDRLGYGENSWLAAGATLGLMGFIPMVMFGIECLKMIVKLMGLSKRQPAYFLHCSTVIAGLASLLVGSFFEAFLLGNLSFSLLVTLIYLCLGQYLLEVEQRERDYYLPQNFLNSTFSRTV
ncbi:MAG: O-antigen ligase family protein [Moorea sp. SIO3G5]|nr:O-antigen ligase family protein [Moorena sp. SIO3G5]